MAENRNVDEFIYESCRKEKESLLALGPDFHKIETEALAQFKHRKKARVRKIWVRATAAVAAVFIIVNGAAILSAVPDARAYRETMRKLFFNFANTVPAGSNDKLVLQTTEALKEVQEKVPYQIPFPHWLPEGYEVSNAYAEQNAKNVYSVAIQYDKPNADKMIEIHMTNAMEFSSANPSPDEALFEKKEIAGYNVYIRVKGNNPHESLLYMFYYNDLSVTVTGPFDAKEFAQILVSFQQ